MCSSPCICCVAEERSVGPAGGAYRFCGTRGRAAPPLGDQHPVIPVTEWHTGAVYTSCDCTPVPKVSVTSQIRSVSMDKKCALANHTHVTKTSRAFRAGKSHPACSKGHTPQTYVPPPIHLPRMLCMQSTEVLVLRPTQAHPSQKHIRPAWQECFAEVHVLGPTRTPFSHQHTPHRVSHRPMQHAATHTPCILSALNFTCHS